MKQIYFKLNKKIYKSWLKEQKTQQQTSQPQQTHKPRLILDTHKSYKELKEVKPNAKDPNRPFPVDNNIFMEENNTSINGGGSFKFYREFKKTNEKEPKEPKETKKKQKEKKITKKRIKQNNENFKNGTLIEEDDKKSIKEITDFQLIQTKKEVKEVKNSMENFEKIEENLDKVMNMLSEAAENDVYVELGIQDIGGEKDKCLTKKQTKDQEFQQLIEDVLKFNPSAKYYYSALFSLDSLLERIVSRNYCEEITTFNFDNLITLKSPEHEQQLKDSFIEYLQQNEKNQFKERDLKERFYKTMLGEYGQILDKDYDAKWRKKQMQTAERNEQKLIEMKQHRLESQMPYQVRYNWLHRIKSMLVICRSNLMRINFSFKPVKYEIYKSVFDKSLALALVIENPSFNLENLDQFQQT